ncbi:hypothetical protein RJ639_003404 [Escallonia herrerae]|uniref:Retrotransposon gag domain-containing protein n=1 Tax=Escallonia herrerae TaxID=1293975 RepID=A0AA88W398_9ASTE|nr:hypothetical protein RJ639_003404 [Escallonia herrerae]
MPESRSHNGAREARQVDNFFWHLERRRYTDGCDIKAWDRFKLELKRQFYPESIKDMAMINLRRLRQKGSIREYVKEYSTLMLEIPEMSKRQRLCFFVDGLQQWVATELR